MLPKTTEEVSEANEMLKQLVVPRVMVETDLEKRMRLCVVGSTLMGGVISAKMQAVFEERNSAFKKKKLG